MIPFRRFDYSIGWIISTLVLASLAACKPKSQSTLQSLEDLEGIGGRLNYCGPGPDSEGVTLEEEDVVFREGSDAGLLDTVTDTAKAVPAGVVQYLQAARGRIIVTPDVAAECAGFQPILDFDGKDRWDVSKGDSCLIVDPKVSSSNSSRPAMPRVAIVIRADRAKIRHGLVRQFGALFASVMTSAVTVKRGSYSEVGIFRSKFFEPAKSGLLSAYLWDLWNNKFMGLQSLDRSIGAGAGKLLVPHMVAAANKNSRGIDLGQFLLPNSGKEVVQTQMRINAFKMQVLAEAFDQYFCNIGAPFDGAGLASAKTRNELTRALKTQKNTRKIMEVVFPDTFAVFEAVVIPALRQLPVVKWRAASGGAGLSLADPVDINVQREKLTASYGKLYDSGYWQRLEKSEGEAWNRRLDDRALAKGKADFASQFFTESTREQIMIERSNDRLNVLTWKLQDQEKESRAAIEALKNPDALKYGKDAVTDDVLATDPSTSRALSPFASAANPFQRYNMRASDPRVRDFMIQERANWATPEAAEQLVKNPDLYYKNAFAREAAGNLSPEKQTELRAALTKYETDGMASANQKYDRVADFYSDKIAINSTRQDLRRANLGEIFDNEAFSPGDRDLAKWMNTKDVPVSGDKLLKSQAFDRTPTYLPPDQYKEAMIKEDVAQMKSAIALNSAGISAVGAIPGGNVLAGLSDAGLQLYAGSQIGATEYFVKDAALSAAMALPVAGQAGFIAKAESLGKATSTTGRVAAAGDLAATTVGTGALAYQLGSAGTGLSEAAITAATRAKADPGFSSLSPGQQELVTRSSAYKEELTTKFFEYAKIAKAREDTISDLKMKLDADPELAKSFEKDPESVYKKLYETHYDRICKAAGKAGIKLLGDEGEGCDVDSPSPDVAGPAPDASPVPAADDGSEQEGNFSSGDEVPPPNPAPLPTVEPLPKSQNSEDDDGES